MRVGVGINKQRKGFFINSKKILSLLKTMEPNTSSMISDYSHPSPSYIITPSFTPLLLTRGFKVNGHVSPIRRFFCSFVIFDLLLTSLLWLIILVLSGNFNWELIYHQQILHYNIKTTLFDIQMTAVFRFVILLLFYALLEISHWCVVALTTAATCTLLTVKVYVYDWGENTSQVLEVIFILSTFILVWSELWLMDIKVVPQENAAQSYLNALVQDDRAPLLRPRRINDERDTSNFYSPYEDSTDSSDGDDRYLKRGRRPIKNDTMYTKKGKQLVVKALDTLNNEKWIFEKKADEGDMIYKQKIDGHTIYRLIGEIQKPISDLKKILYDDFETLSDWNPSVQEARVLQIINSTTDISLNVTKKVGIVSSREYILLRHYQEKNKRIIIATESISWPRHNSSVVRGENGPGCWALRALADDKTEVMWLLDTKINGWVPKLALEFAMVNVLSTTMTYLRKHCSSF